MINSPYDVNAYAKGLSAGASAREAAARARLYDIQGQIEQMQAGAKSREADALATLYGAQGAKAAADLEDANAMRTIRKLYNDVSAGGGTDTDFAQAARDQGMGYQGQQFLNTAQQQAMQSPRMQQLRSMATTALGAEDDDEFDALKEDIGKQLTPDELKAFGNPEDWTRASIARFVDPTTAENLTKFRLAYKGKVDVQQAKNDAKTEKPDATFTPKQLADMTRHNEEVANAQDFIDKQRAGGMKDGQIQLRYADQWKKAQEAPYKDVPFRRAAGAAPAQQTLDPATASKILVEAGGDKAKARQIAKQRGYTF